MSDRPDVPDAPQGDQTMPQVSSDLSARMRRVHGEGLDPSITLHDDASLPSSPSAGRPPGDGPLVRSSHDRYVFEGEIARGGMGAVLAIRDEELRRRLAMKVILPREDGSIDPVTLARFLEEAQVTAQLDHPGVVPVHELGQDPEGQVYFTMKRVRGEDLRSVFEKVHRSEEGWSIPRALGLLQRACEALAFAHSKGVLHRDLKPGNVMVGRFGEVFVMDWGLARVLGQEDHQDLRIRPPAHSTRVQSTRREQGNTPDSPLLTMEGRVVGTPAYMPVEQAEGRQEEIGPESDVYSMGAMLYELLTGRMPYVRPGASPSPHTILAAVLHAPPEPIATLAPQTPPELLAICEKAMARSKAERYSTMEELSTDLRSYLENRVVQAYRTGPIVEMRKWVQRNRGLAASMAAGVLLLLVLGATAAVAVVTRKKNAQLDLANGSLQESNSELTQTNVALTESRTMLASANQELNSRNEELDLANATLDSRNQLLSDLETLRDLREREQGLWPARPRLAAAMADWIEDAQQLVLRLPDYEERLLQLRQEAAEFDDSALDEALSRSPRRQEYEDTAVLLARIEQRSPDETPPPPTNERERRAAKLDDPEFLLARRQEIARSVRGDMEWRFPGEPEKRWLHDNLTELVQGMEGLTTPDTGLLALVRARLDRAQEIELRTIDDAFDAWLEAMDGIADSERYQGDELSREQVGLVPLGIDPDSGLWEFWHVESGSRPEWTEDGGVAPDEDMGLVMVLIPGGAFQMGAERDPAAPNHDPIARRDEGPVNEVRLEPYLLSKYELTQGQWARLTGQRPSFYAKGAAASGANMNDRHPVTDVTWEDCAEVLPRYGLRMPSEAQWEHACRAGTHTPWWWGEHGDVDGAAPPANLFDEGSLRRNPESAAWGNQSPWDDGFTVHAPVGNYRANDFGLHDTLGNVWEWCEDVYASTAYGLPPSPDDGHRFLLAPSAVDEVARVNRGGSFVTPARGARCAFRMFSAPAERSRHTGVRPAMEVQQD